MQLHFGRWSIRPYRRADKPALIECANDPRVTQHLSDRFPHPYTAQHADAWLDFCLAQDQPQHWALTEEDRVIGGIRLERQHDIFRYSAEIGYWLGQAHWGQGIATVAVANLVNHTFHHTDLQRVQAGIFAGNPASSRVLEKVGFLREGVRRAAVCKHEQFMDEIMYAILRDDWLTAQRNP